MIEVTRNDGIVVLRMQHGKANALDTELCTELTNTLQDIGSLGNAVVLTGQGKMFSAGVDLIRLLDSGEAYRSALVKALTDVLHALFFLPKPVVAAVNGHAIAGGCILASAADYRILTTGACRVGVPELTVGVPFPPIALEIMRFTTSPQYFPQLVLRGVTCPPEEALAWGLADELAADETVLNQSMLRAVELAAIPSRTFELTKLQARQPVLKRLQQASMQQLATQIQEAWNSTEVVAAVRKYVEKTLKK